jgi:hypothetical protein
MPTVVRTRNASAEIVLRRMISLQNQGMSNVSRTRRYAAESPERCGSLSAQPDAMENMRRRRCVRDYGNRRDGEDDRWSDVERHRNGGDEIRRNYDYRPMILARQPFAAALHRRRGGCGRLLVLGRRRFPGGPAVRTGGFVVFLGTDRLRLRLGDRTARGLSRETAPSRRQRHRDAEQEGNRFREQGAHVAIISSTNGLPTVQSGFDADKAVW